VNSPRAQLRRRSRRGGLIFIAASPAIGVLFSVLFRPEVGILLGAICLAVGVYAAFAYVPFADWLRRREKPR
jgi:hypothetical protein